MLKPPKVRQLRLRWRWVLALGRVSWRGVGLLAWRGGREQERGTGEVYTQLTNWGSSSWRVSASMFAGLLWCCVRSAAEQQFSRLLFLLACCLLLARCLCVCVLTVIYFCCCCCGRRRAPKRAECRWCPLLSFRACCARGCLWCCRNVVYECVELRGRTVGWILNEHEMHPHSTL